MSSTRKGPVQYDRPFLVLPGMYRNWNVYREQEEDGEVSDVDSSLGYNCWLNMYIFSMRVSMHFEVVFLALRVF